MADDLTLDVDDRDLIIDPQEGVDALSIDVEDRDFVLDPHDGDIAVEFHATGAPGASAYQVWLAAGNVGTIDDYLAAGGGITLDQFQSSILDGGNF
jgi:hypothetical protein